ncbi:MAG: IPT/TIG domain-containing protein, partial [Patescibacteria group bacterium]
MSKFTKNLAIVAFLVLAGLTLANFVLAQGVDVGLNYGEQIGLNNTDPRIMAANVIRIVLGFLGVIAVGLIIYAGWLYMTAGGEEEKIEKAKKILINAIIGLIIILSSFAIATFVLNRMLAATNPSAISDEGSGGGATPGGGGIPEEGETPGGENEDVSCSDSDSACVANNTKCEDGYHCNTSCICEAGGGYEESCDSAPDSATCEADDGACSAYLTCDTGTCTCLGAPVIEWVSPMDESDTPNGKPGNMITIGGRYFGDEPGKVYFFDGKEAQFPGAPCTSNWRNDQIIVLVPAGAVNGPIRIERADGANDTTSNDRGPVINDFVKNDIARPGICKIDPTEGVMDSPINYYGFGLSGSVAYFGSASNNVLASNSTFNNNTQGKADVSDIRTGRTSTFVSNNGENSNYLGFKKNPEPYAGPKIISFEPASGAPGQYVTIHGSGFGAVKGSSEVYFSESPKIRANYDFPEICADSVWSDNQVIVKVPTGSSLMTSFITMEVVSGGKTYNISSNNLFTINSNPLTPSLCKIDPVMGPNNAPISLWGENFGEQADVSVKFYSNRNQSDIDSWSIEGGAQKIVTSVQPEAQTGPVQVAKGTLVSNSLNFNVGSCVQNADCASGVCCPFDSNEAGQCRTDLNNCYSNITGSVYEWEFSTGNSGSERGGCSDEQISCGASCCSSEIGCFDDLHNCCEEGNCPPDGEITCGDETCIAEECINGECPSSQCASGQTVCGLGCCDDGVACAADNQCENSPCSESEIQCVTECCATACVDGACSQADRPGETCFAEGAPSTCSVYPATCGANYSCMAFETDTCGTCC